MTWNRLMLVLAGIAGAGLIAIACGGDDNSNKACQVDGDCSSGQICHPLAKFCVATCTDSSSCPDSEKNCNALTLPDGSTTSQKICQCNADADCGGGTGSSNICGTEDKVCEVKCGSDADCNSGRKCDTASGQCKTEQAAGGCNPANTTLGANGGPDTCNYGEACAADNQCHPVTNDTAATCTQAGAQGSSNWDGNDHSAPIITNVTATGVADETAPNTCGGGPASIFTIDYYAPGGLTGNSADSFGVWKSDVWFNLNASVPFNNPAFNADGTLDGTQVFNEIKVGVCGLQSGTAALFIQNVSGAQSNTVCVTY